MVTDKDQYIERESIIRRFIRRVVISVHKLFFIILNENEKID